MPRISREIARDVARVTAASVVEILLIRGDEGEHRIESAAVEGLALSTRPARERVTATLHGLAAQGDLPEDARALLAATPPPRVVTGCEPALEAALNDLGLADRRCVFHRLTAEPGEVALLRVVVRAPVRGATLRALDAIARLAGGRLEGEGHRRTLAGRSAAYRAFQEGAGEGILVADAGTGQLLDVNPKLCELTGRSRAELRRRTLPDLLEHPVLDAGALLARLCRDQVVREDEARLRRRRGEPIPVAVTSARIALDGRPVLHVIARDVTRERRALDDLRQAKETLAALHVAGAHLMVETDEEAIFGVLARELGRLGFQCGVLAPALDGGSGLVWRFLSFPQPVRRALDRVLGRPLGAVRIDPAVEPLLRRCLVERRTVHTDAARRTVQALLGGATPQQLRRLGRLVGIRRVILAPLRRENRAVAVLVVASAKVRRSDPEAIDAFALQASIALEKARLFSALRDERARLETEVERRTAELRQAVAGLEQADRRKDNFLANISHELRTPLVTVLGYSDLLLGEKLGPVTARQRNALEVVTQSARRLKSFIEELLELSRHELTKEEAYTFAPFAIGDVATQAVISLAPRFAERGLRVRVRVARNVPRALGDRERVLQVLVNLLANAERYSPDGSPIRVAAAETRPGRIEVSVADRGAGIAPEHLGHIFDRLYQVRDDRSPRHKGGALGIGLTIVKSIVEAHGGEVSVRSRVGRGTTFRFSLPVAADVAAASGGDAPDAATG